MLLILLYLNDLGTTNGNTVFEVCKICQNILQQEIPIIQKNIYAHAEA
mgnify:CR=1 FL=1